MLYSFPPARADPPLVLHADIAYGTAARQKLDIYEASEPATGAPVVIFFYGGGWQNGKKADYKFVAEALAKNGIATVIPDYRLYPDVTFPSFIEDGAQAVAWTRGHIKDYGGNPHDIFLMGFSEGAYIAAMLALDNAYLVKAGPGRGDITGVIGLAGLYNFLPLARPDFKPIFPVADLTTTQPITYADGKNPPLLLLAGDDDDKVDPQNTTSLADRIQSHGGPVTSIMYPHTGHIGIMLPFSPLFHGTTPVVSDIVTFITAHERP